MTERKPLLIKSPKLLTALRATRNLALNIFLLAVIVAYSLDWLKPLFGEASAEAQLARRLVLSGLVGIFGLVGLLLSAILEMFAPSEPAALATIPPPLPDAKLKRLGIWVTLGLCVIGILVALSLWTFASTLQEFLALRATR